MVNSDDSFSNNYVICIADFDESDLLTRGRSFKTTFKECGQFIVKCSINYKMKASIEVKIPKPKTMEWEDPVIPHINKFVSKNEAPATVDKVNERSSTSIEEVKERSLTQKLHQVLANEEHLTQKSLSRKELEATFNNYSPIVINMLKDELKRDEPITEEQKHLEEVEEQKFLEQQRTSSLGSRARSRSNRHTPESDKAKDALYNLSSK